MRASVWAAYIHVRIHMGDCVGKGTDVVLTGRHTPHSGGPKSSSAVPARLRIGAQKKLTDEWLYTSVSSKGCVCACVCVCIHLCEDVR